MLHCAGANNLFCQKVLFPLFLNYAVYGNKKVIGVRSVCLQCWADISWWLCALFQGASGHFGRSRNMVIFIWSLVEKT